MKTFTADVMTCPVFSNHDIFKGAKEPFFHWEVTASVTLSLLTRCCGLSCVFPPLPHHQKKVTLQSGPPGPQHVTSSGYKVVADVIR